MGVENKEVLAVLEAVLSYLSITLPSQQLSPDAQMGRETLMTKVEGLLDKINSSKTVDNNGSDKIDGAVAANEGDLGSESKMNEAVERQRMSSYMDMSQLQSSLSSPDPIHMPDVGKEIEAEQQLNYEVPGVSEVLELDEEDDETYDDIAKNLADSRSLLESQVEINSELTEDELVEKLKGYENTSAKKMTEACICSGWLMKQKKKLLSKWHRRFCVMRDEFLFYYEQEEDSKSLGVIVLPGRVFVNEKSSSKDKSVFKLVPTAKGRSTYLFSALSRDDYGKWEAALSPICSQKLERLESKVFNRLATKMNGDSDEGSAGESIKSAAPPISEDVYEVLPDEGPFVGQQQGGSFDMEYDDHIGDTSAANFPIAALADAGNDLYEGIPGESLECAPASSGDPIEEDIYDTIDIVVARNSAQSTFPSRPAQEPVPPSPNQVLAPPLPPSLPPRGSFQDKRDAPPPLPPSIPSREKTSNVVELIEEESSEEEDETYDDHIAITSSTTAQTLTAEEDVPAENDFSYDNVYIGTEDHTVSEQDELEFKCGDLIYVLEKINPDWWIGCLEEKVGLVPSYLLLAGFAH